MSLLNRHPKATPVHQYGNYPWQVMPSGGYCTAILLPFFLFNYLDSGFETYHSNLGLQPIFDFFIMKWWLIPSSPDEYLCRTCPVLPKNSRSLFLFIPFRRTFWSCRTIYLLQLWGINNDEPWNFGKRIGYEQLV